MGYDQIKEQFFNVELNGFEVELLISLLDSLKTDQPSIQEAITSVRDKLFDVSEDNEAPMLSTRPVIEVVFSKDYGVGVGTGEWNR